MIRTSEQIDAISAALCEAQKKFTPAFKTSENPFYSKGDKLSLYADMAEIIDACLKHLNDSGISVMQHPSLEYREIGESLIPYITVTTRLQHTSSQFFESDFSVPAAAVRQADEGDPEAKTSFNARKVKLAKFDAQTCGAATTYACRYALQSIATLKRYDDDGEAASAVQSKSAQKEVAERKVARAKDRMAKRAEGSPGPVPVSATLFHVHYPESNTYQIQGTQELLHKCRDILKPYWNQLARSVVVPDEKLDDVAFELERAGVGLRPLKPMEQGA